MDIFRAFDIPVANLLSRKDNSLQETSHMWSVYLSKIFPRILLAYL